MPYAGRSRVRRRSVGRPRRRSTTIKLQDKATFHNRKLSVYSKEGGPEDRVVFPGENDASFNRARVGETFQVQYLRRPRQATKSVRLVNRGGRTVSVPVLEFFVK